MATFIPQSHGRLHVNAWLRKGLSHLNNHKHHTFLFRCMSRNSRSSSTMARTYESALSHLAALQSNRAITSLFSPPEIATPPAAGTSAPPKQDLNALAIPEMLAWLKRAGLSQDDLAARLRCIHVAGTKGKGSVCAYLTALLTHSGEAGKVGTYTSPHLVSVRERIAIDGAPISQALFARYFFEVWDACTEAARAELLSRQAGPAGGTAEEISEEALQGPATKPFYFRFLTIVALRAFLGEGVRSAVIECGIGGEYDSTNVLPAASVTASVVAQLGIDHVGMLGATLPEIAWHKAGVCKPGRKCFTRRLEGASLGAQAAATMEVLQSRAREKGATLVEVCDADVERWGGVAAGGDGAGRLEGEFQKYNQALAVHAAREHLRVLASEASGSSEGADTAAPTNEKLEAIPPAFTAALQHARLRGRCETRADERAPLTWYIDGAHTAESLAAVAQWFAGKIRADADGARQAARKVLVFNQQDRDAAQLLRGLLRDVDARAGGVGTVEEGPHVFAHAVYTRNDLAPPRRGGRSGGAGEAAEPARDLSVQRAAAETSRLVSPPTATSLMDSVEHTVLKVRNMANRYKDTHRTIVLVTGSLHLVGALLRTLEPDAED